jgi:hypothetical protein
MSTIQVTNIKHASSNTNSIELDSGGAVTLPKVNSINGGPLAGFRNAIINGNFDIWQRGTSGTTGYVADRFTALVAGSDVTQSRQTFTLGQTDVPNEPTYFHRTDVTSVAGVNNFAFLRHRIEDVRTFATQLVTCSFWAKADSSKNIAIEFAQAFGTGGSPSGLVSFGVTTCALTASWQKFSLTTTCPAILGKTLGSDSNSSLQIAFWFDAGSNFNSRTNSLGQQSGTFDIAQVQVEAGPVATPFERRPIGTELALCQRYYCETKAAARMYVDTTSRTMETPIYWPVEMRVDPTTTVATGGLRQSVGTVSVLSPSKTYARFSITSSAGPGEMWALNEIVTASAEL